MHQSEKAEFVKTLNLCYATLLKPLPPVEALSLWWAVLEPYSLDQVRAALSQHMRESKFPPVPADVVTRLPRESDGRPDANEAWAISLRSRDERETVVWTQECAEAFETAREVLDVGDEVGARMAFKAKYERLVEEARASGKPAQWVKSLGHDPALREAAITEAVRGGRLSLADARVVLPALAAPEEVGDPAQAEANLARLRQLVGAIPSAAEKLARAQQERERSQREATEQAKARAAQLVAEYEWGEA